MYKSSPPSSTEAHILVPVKNFTKPPSALPYGKISIVIPCFNESNTICLILEKIAEVELLHGMAKEIIIVNDCSTDNTHILLEQYIKSNSNISITYILHATNQGKGAAIQTGLRHTTGDFILIQDADLEYDPSEYNTLLKPLINNVADVVYGSRFMGGNPHRILFFWHSIGNRFLTFCSNALSNINLTDMETGYKIFRSDIIKQIQLREKRYGFEPEITAKIARIPDIRIYEVGISYYGRTFKEGKKIKWKDGFRALYCMLKYKFSRNGR